MKRKIATLLFLFFFISGCSSTVNTSNTFFPENEIELIAHPLYEDDFSAFDGLEIAQKTPDFEDNAQNLIINTMFSGIVYKDYKSGWTYYTALGYDNFLHRKNDDKDEIVLEKSVWGINIVGDKLYCIMDSEKPVQNFGAFANGDIYCLDLNNKELNLVLETKAVNAVIIDNKINFVYDNGFGQVVYNSVYECDLTGQNIVKKDSGILGYAGEYYLGYDETGQSSTLINSITGEKNRFTASNNVYSFFSVDNYAYYETAKSKLYRMDLKNGEEITISPDKKYKEITIKVTENETEKLVNDNLTIGGYYVDEGYVYTVFDILAFKIKIGGETEAYISPLTTDGGWYYADLFYDGNSFYTVKYNLSKNYYKLVRVEYSDESDSTGLHKTLKEYDVL